MFWAVLIDQTVKNIYLEYCKLSKVIPNQPKIGKNKSEKQNVFVVGQTESPGQES